MPVILETVSGASLQSHLLGNVTDPIADPLLAARTLAPRAKQALGKPLQVIQWKLMSGVSAAAHFTDCFPIDPALPATPLGFTAAPHAAWLEAARAALALLGALDLTPSSYASENGGVLFQHLTKQPTSAGRSAEKSREELRGHTDAVYHVLPPEQRTPPCSVSPDFVVLMGLRNPDKTATRVVSLSPLLKIHLDQQDVALFQDPVFDVSPQPSFNLSAIEYGVPILSKDPNRGWLMRYSNTKVVTDEIHYPKHFAALERLRATLTTPPPGLLERAIVAPGDILLVNNRMALHGRDKLVDGPEGGGSRWLVRTYGVSAGSTPLIQDRGSPWVLHP